MIEDANYELKQVAQKINELEQEILMLEKKVPKTYPDVKFLNYLDRKRILVIKYIITADEIFLLFYLFYR